LQLSVADITSHESLERFLTETGGTVSVCMVLAAMLRNDAAHLLPTTDHQTTANGDAKDAAVAVDADDVEGIAAVAAEERCTG
jgi:hypothetical protein